jgi:hypothetical protein
MNEWISVPEISAPPTDILVYGTCGSVHVGHWSGRVHKHVECCFQGGGHFEGEEIEFTHWMQLPEPPGEFKGEIDE